VRSIHLLSGAVALVAVALLGARAIVDDGSAVPTVRVTPPVYPHYPGRGGVARGAGNPHHHGDGPRGAV